MKDIFNVKKSIEDLEDIGDNSKGFNPFSPGKQDEDEVEVCEYCEGTGEVDVWDRDESTGYNWVIVDTKPCFHCRDNQND